MVRVDVEMVRCCDGEVLRCCDGEVLRCLDGELFAATPLLAPRQSARKAPEKIVV